MTKNKVIIYVTFEAIMLICLRMLMLWMLWNDLPPSNIYIHTHTNIHIYMYVNVWIWLNVHWQDYWYDCDYDYYWDYDSSAFLFDWFTSNSIFSKNAYVSFVGIFSDLPAIKEEEKQYINTNSNEQRYKKYNLYTKQWSREIVLLSI